MAIQSLSDIDQARRASRSRSRVLPDRETIRLGMPHLGLTGLCENWLLREAGHRHWMAVCEHLGVPPQEITDLSGDRLFPSIVACVVSGAPLAGFREHDIVDLWCEGRPVSGGRHYTRTSLVCPTSSVATTVELMSMLVKRASGSANGSLQRAEWPEPWTERVNGDGEVDREVQLLKAKATAARLSFDRAAPGHRFEYAVCPPTDFNGVGFLYFANFLSIIERAEWGLFRHVLPPLLTPRYRSLYYFGNVDPGDLIDVHADFYTRIESPDAPEVEMTYWLNRRSDGAPLAYSIVVKRQDTRPGEGSAAGG